jgi:hypothetical protein
MLLLLQVATQAVENPMAVSTDLPAIIATSSISVAIIQWMKNSNLPFLKAFSQESSGLNRLMAWVAALIAGVGIHYHYDPSLGALTITGLTGAAIYSAAVSATKSYGFNWLIYNTAVKNRAADVSAVAGGMPVTPVVGPGVAKAGVEQANEGTKP